MVDDAKICPVCRSEIAEPARFCPRDGCPLARPRSGVEPGAMSLTILTMPDAGTECPLESAPVRVGRAADNDVVVCDPLVSEHHVALRLEGERWVIADAGSGAGTLVDGEPLGRAALELLPGDVVTLGASRLLFDVCSARAAGRPGPPPGSEAPTRRFPAAPPAGEPLHVVALLAGGEQRAATLTTGLLRIGQSPDNGLSIPDPSVSHHHATVRLEDGRCRIYDLGSLNGTYVNGDRVGRGGHDVDAGDIVTIGYTHLLLGEDGHVPRPGGVTDARLEEHSSPLAQRPTHVIATLPSGGRLVAPLACPVLTIGTEAENGLAPADPAVSHRHAILRHFDGWWHVYDFGSRNGTFVNGQPVGPNGYVLLASDTITVGGTSVRFGFGPVAGC